MIGLSLSLLFVLASASAQYIAFDHAKASSIYSAGNLAGSPGFAAARAVDSGSGYWCSAGNHAADQVVTWTGSLDSRRKAIGLKINWAYGPGEAKVLISADGANFEEARCWQSSSRDAVSYEESIMFDSERNVEAVVVAVRGPKSWAYFGINEIVLIAGRQESFMLTSGATSETQLCLVAKSSILAMAPCLEAIAAGDGEEIFQFSSEGQLQHLDGGCVVVAGGVTTGGGSVLLGDCEKALRANDGRSQWEISASGQLKLSGNYCLTSKLVVQDCGEAGQTIDAGDKWFQSSVTEFNPAAKSALSGVPLLKAAAEQLKVAISSLRSASSCGKNSVQLASQVLASAAHFSSFLGDPADEAVAMIPAAAGVSMASLQELVAEARLVISEAKSSLK